jgi:PKD repeat protein
MPISGAAQFTFQFTDESTGDIDSWAWDFNNDGTVDSTQQNPSYIYNTPGTYTVSLEIAGPGGSDTETKSDYITAYGMPTAAFASSQTSSDAPLTVQFTDQSTGIITQWLWGFGDGQTSSEQNPSHTYASPGGYTVSLTVSGPGGSDNETKTDYIYVYYPSAWVARYNGLASQG